MSLIKRGPREEKEGEGEGPCGHFCSLSAAALGAIILSFPVALSVGGMGFLYAEKLCNDLRLGSEPRAAKVICGRDECQITKTSNREKHFEMEKRADGTGRRDARFQGCHTTLKLSIRRERLPSLFEC